MDMLTEPIPPTITTCMNTIEALRNMIETYTYEKNEIPLRKKMTITNYRKSKL